MPRAANIPDEVTAGGDTVGVRWPSHPFIQAVIRACEFPLAAPSANISNEISPTNAEHVRQRLGRRIPLIVDGGQAQIGIESTVVDLAAGPARVLRHGMIHEESLAAALGVENLASPGHGEGGALRSPGLLKRHYAPSAPLVTLSWDHEEQLAAQLAPFKLPRERIHVVAYRVIPLRERFGRVAVMPHDAEAFGRALYAELHACDAAGAGLIVVEAPPKGPGWRGIADRLARAAAV